MMMRTLLLLSKAVALEEGARSVTLKHFEKALTYGQIVSARAKTLLYTRFGDITEVQPPSATEPDDLIQMARQAPPLKIMPALQELLRRLDATGEEYFSLHSPVGLPSDLAHIVRIEKLLRGSLLGQGDAIGSLLAALGSRALLKCNPKSVAGSYVFAGPTGCGKTMAARLLAEGLGEYPVMELDCSAFDSANERFVFDGSPSAYSGARPGQLTTFVRENPRCMVVLEHFSRMNPALQTVLLPILEQGSLRDNYGFFKDKNPKSEEIASPDVDFSQVHLVLTTDAGADLYDHPALIERLRQEGGAIQLESALVDALRAARNETSVTPGPSFDPAVLSRILANGTAILFEKLDFDALRSMCARNLPRAGEALLDGVGGGVIDMGQNADELIDLLVVSHGGQADARKFSIEALTRGFYAPLIQRWMVGSVRNHVTATLPEADAMELRSIMDELGKDPIRTLFRQMRRVQFDIKVTEDAARTALVCCRPRLVKIASATDYHGSGALLMETPEIRFKDIAGHEALKAKLRQQISLLSNFDTLAKNGLRAPGGLLLYGPAGTGKTSMARALAGEADLPFIAITAPELFNLDFQRRLFEKLRRYAPAILFIDEIDALGKRGDGLDPAINTLLAEIDGFRSHDDDARVFVVGATNFPEKVDSALLRPGRMELIFEVGLPDREARKNLLRRGLADSSEQQIERLVDLSSGMSGAAIEAVRRDVVLLSHNRESVKPEMVAGAIDNQRFGPLEPMTDVMKAHVALHEAGHALALYKLCSDERVDCIRVGCRETGAGRVTTTRNRTGAQPRTRQRVKAELMALLAGRAAQVLRYGEEDGIDDGASSDLANAVELATNAVITWGLDPVLGTQALVLMSGKASNHPLPRTIVRRIDAWLKEADSAILEFLNTHRSLLETITQRLVTDGVLDHSQLVELFEADSIIQGEPS